MSAESAGLRTSLPLATLLSQVLVAFTIEFDNEAEHRMPHWTTIQRAAAGARGGPWLTSMVMYLNCMRFVGEDPITVGEVEELARTKTNWNGMERWGYIKVAPDPADARPKPPVADWLVRATRKGQMAREIWRPLFGVIEERWRERFGEDVISQLRASLLTLTRQFSVELPDCMPILKYGLFSKDGSYQKRDPAGSDDGSDLYFPSLVSRALLAFAIPSERKSDVSLAISANVLRVLGEKPLKMRDLPVLTGVSKESINMAMGILEKRGIAVVGPDPGGRGKAVHLTPAGRIAQEASQRLAGAVEEGWVARFGAGAIGKLRELLERLVGEPAAETSPLFRGLTPYPDGWRASVAPPKTLPHFPMVLHRGGYPDGS